MTRSRSVPEDALTAAEAGRLTGLTRQAIDKAYRQGRLPAYFQDGKYIYFSIRDVRRVWRPKWGVSIWNLPAAATDELLGGPPMKIDTEDNTGVLIERPRPIDFEKKANE